MKGDLDVATREDVTVPIMKGRRKKKAAKPNPKAPLGQGGRFAAVKQEVAAKGATNPGALAAWIGRKKYGAKKMAAMSAAGRKG